MTHIACGYRTTLNSLYVYKYVYLKIISAIVGKCCLSVARGTRWARMRSMAGRSSRRKLCRCGAQKATTGTSRLSRASQEKSAATGPRYIPFHRFISGNEAHTDETKIRQEDRESVQRKRTEALKTQQHAVKQSKHKKHTYTSTQLT